MPQVSRPDSGEWRTLSVCWSEGMVGLMYHSGVGFLAFLAFCCCCIKRYFFKMWQWHHNDYSIKGLARSQGANIAKTGLLEKLDNRVHCRVGMLQIWGIQIKISEHIYLYWLWWFHVKSPRKTRPICFWFLTLKLKSIRYFSEKKNTFLKNFVDFWPFLDFFRKS